MTPEFRRLIRMHAPIIVTLFALSVASYLAGCFAVWLVLR